MRKRIIISILAAILLATIGCKDDNEDNLLNPMILTFRGPETVSISLSGSGIADISWGDGGEIETITFSSGDLEFAPKIKRDYTGSTTRTIKISGENITGLNCGYNDILTLDVSKNTALTELRCTNASLTKLDVSKNAALTTLFCNGNQLLTSLDISQNTKLTELWCTETKLTEIDVSNNTALTTLFCCYNRLVELDVSNNTALSTLDCGNNQLTSLDISKNIGLSDLRCYNNQLTGLDVSENLILLQLDCSNNQLTSLKSHRNGRLSYVRCERNKLDAEALNAFFVTLNWGTGSKVLFIENNPGSDDCDKSFAENKGYVFCYD